MSANYFVLQDDLTGSRASILPSRGFNCFSFQAAFDQKPIEMLWSASDFVSGQGRPSGSGIPLLFPFPGRIRGTSYQFQGQTYPLSPDDAFGNAIHGFIYTRPWRVVELQPAKIVGEFQASLDDPAILEQWPADFRIQATYTLQGNALLLELNISNPDQKVLPFGLGMHPYFRVPLGKTGDLDQVLVRVPASEKWELQEMLPTGKRSPISDQQLAQGIPFTETRFDDVFTELKPEGSEVVSELIDRVNRRKLTISFSDNFANCVVFNPPHREAICIEPYSCVPNPFELEAQGVSTGLRFLAPGEEFLATMRIEAQAFRDEE